MNKLRRVLAWVLLAGFLFLIFNIIVLRFYWQISMIIYVIIIFWFVLMNRGSSNVKYYGDQNVNGGGADDRNDENYRGNEGDASDTKNAGKDTEDKEE